MTTATRRLRLAYIRAALATRETDCAGTDIPLAAARRLTVCPGWFTSDRGIARCDNCAHAIGLGDPRLFNDDDAAALARTDRRRPRP